MESFTALVFSGTPVRIAVRFAFLVSISALAGCKKDCRETVRLGDFEYSQGNYANAAKRYAQALREDPACYNVEAKLKDARERSGAR